ncbi:DNA-directed RNA polymerase II subunit J [Achlya hypogyna]|uniref:DNA-directed RNA polymerase II subunit J n=1 Tax=Achlya hypogyna TaxID=1202772 RepID=A0A1V9YGV1_ACHHY|nr:DNA-directed RNA polymerase II subunit J [Achlya hypogyna]
MNAPSRSDAYLLPDGAQKVTYEKDTRINNAGQFTILREDHTVANLVRMQLLRDPNVTFAGYMHPHPLINDIKVRIQTNNNSSPIEALGNCLDDLSTEFEELAQRFRRLSTKDQGGFS